MKKMLRIIGLGSGILVASFMPSHAATVGFGTADVDPYFENVFRFDVVDIVTGSCASGPCMKLNRNQSSTMTLASGGVFSMSSFWFQLLGSQAVLKVMSFSGLTNLETIIFNTAGYPANNGGQVFNHLFAGATSIKFINIGRSSIRVDNINAVPGDLSAVPVPTALPLFVSGLAALGFVGLRRRRREQI